MDQLGFLWSTDTEDCESQWYMMPIRMRGNCRLHRHHDRLPPPPWGPSSETRFHEVMLSLKVLSAVDLDCSLPRGHGQGCHEIEAGNTKSHRPDQEAVGGSTLRLGYLVIYSYGNVLGRSVYVLNRSLLHNPAKPTPASPLYNYHFQRFNVINVSLVTMIELMVAAMLILHAHTHTHKQSQLF